MSANPECPARRVCCHISRGCRSGQNGGYPSGRFFRRAAVLGSRLWDKCSSISRYVTPEIPSSLCQPHSNFPVSMRGCSAPPRHCRAAAAASVSGGHGCHILVNRPVENQRGLQSGYSRALDHTPRCRTSLSAVTDGPQAFQGPRRESGPHPVLLEGCKRMKGCDIGKQKLPHDLAMVPPASQASTP